MGREFTNLAVKKKIKELGLQLLKQRILDEASKKRLRQLWNDGYTITDICATLVLTRSQLEGLRVRMKLPARQKYLKTDKERRPPQEIRELEVEFRMALVHVDDLTEFQCSVVVDDNPEIRCGLPIDGAPGRRNFVQYCMHHKRRFFTKAIP
jgi:hypothetical protein